MLTFEVILWLFLIRLSWIFEPLNHPALGEGWLSPAAPFSVSGEGGPGRYLVGRRTAGEEEASEIMKI